VAGVEISTITTGHLNAFPLPHDSSRASGGTPDWAVDETGHRPTFGELFAHVHEQGGLVQANHPRRQTDNVASSTSAYFDRGGLSYDPVTGIPFADPLAQPVANKWLRFGDDVEWFSLDFDAVEVMNGASPFIEDGMVYDRGVEEVGHDWYNLLSAGRKMVAIANSDTHSIGFAPGNPRTMVGGHQGSSGGTAGLVEHLRAGDAVLTTGPMLYATLHNPSDDADSNPGVGPGDLLTTTGNSALLRVRVETADWYSVDMLEVIGDAFFADPKSGGRPQRAGELTALSPTTVVRTNGGPGFVYEVSVTIDLSAAPFAGHTDSWLVVRVGGANSTPLFPAMSGSGSVNLTAENAAEFLSERSGILPFAMTNAIYLDRDGDGEWTP